MDKKALQNFALFAKDSLETQIKVSLKLVGIHSDKDIKKAYIQGDFTIIDGDSKTYPSDLKVKRDHILELIKSDGYAYTIEQFAYTWFNRLIALRFMEVHEYLPHGFKVFPKGNGSIEPEILGKLTLVEKELNLDIELCRQLKEKAQIEELYRYVLFQQCNALSGVLPMLFSKEYAYLELMLPSTLLKGTTVITELIKIDEANFLNDVEVIGWLYQFYISVKKDEVFASKNLINKDTLPAVTQLFTPDWIVRYMTENSLGRLWLESYPDSSIKKEFKYYVDNTEQIEEVKKQIESIRYNKVDPKDIKVIEPCSGSGHILVYAFDVLMLMYEEKGYSKNDIPKLILDNNLFGLDVDKRASQLASFSLIMKARSIDSRFFQTTRISYPKVFEIKDSKTLLSMDYKKKLMDLNNNDWKKDEHLNDEELKVIDYVIETFIDGKVIGSLLKVKRDNYVSLISKMNQLHKVTIRGIFNGEFVEYGLKRIVQLLRLSEVMSKKYDVMLTNPPYIGLSSFDESIKKYASENYPYSKNDMFTMFMDTTFVKKNGYSSLINMQSWMFLSTYENFRKRILSNQTFLSMIHLGARAFESIGGDVVQTTAFIYRNTFIDQFETVYFRLIGENSQQSKQIKFLTNPEKYILKTTSFLIIPGATFSYYAEQQVINCFNKGMTLESISETRQGIIPGNTIAFLRLWYEVNYDKIGFNHVKYEDINNLKFKWFPYNKGGGFRRWYGNIEHVINMENNGYDIKFSGQNNNYRLREPKHYFKRAVTWSKINSGAFSTREMPVGNLYDISGCCIFNIDANFQYILGLTNSIVADKILSIISPTLNYEVDHIKKIPVIIDKKDIVDAIVSENIKIAHDDWDELETSFGFTVHPLHAKNSLIEDTYNRYVLHKSNQKNSLFHNETKLNQLFCEIYNLKFASYEPNKNQIEKTIRVQSRNDIVRSLISYIIGILFGRYEITIDKSSDLTTTLMNSHNEVSNDIKVIPIYKKIGMNDGLDSKLCSFIKEYFGLIYYKANIDFIAEALDKRVEETSEEALTRYLVSEFYDNHIRVYQKRPIYWMMSSGEFNAFQCLIYMHKYTEDTLATINSQYLLPESTRLKYELNELNSQLVKADDKTRRTLEKEKVVLENKYNEIVEYGQVLDHMANRYISIDLDDGVKVNYEKFQGIEIVTDSGMRIKKDLLVPIK